MRNGSYFYRWFNQGRLCLCKNATTVGFLTLPWQNEPLTPVWILEITQFTSKIIESIKTFFLGFSSKVPKGFLCFLCTKIQTLWKSMLHKCKNAAIIHITLSLTWRVNYTACRIILFKGTNASQILPLHAAQFSCWCTSVIFDPPCVCVCVRVRVCVCVSVVSH